MKSYASITHWPALCFQSWQCFNGENSSNLVVQLIAGRPRGPFPKVANGAFGVPNVHEGSSWYGRQISIVQSEWVSEWDLHAKFGSPFRAQARTTNDIYISSSSDFSERNKVIELIHPKGRVVGTMSPISDLFVPPKRLNHWVPTVSRAANSSSMFWEPIQCSNNPSLSWQSGNIVSKFPCSETETFFHVFMAPTISRAKFRRLELQPRIGSYVENWYQILPYQHCGCIGVSSAPPGWLGAPVEGIAELRPATCCRIHLARQCVAQPQPGMLMDTFRL